MVDEVDPVKSSNEVQQAKNEAQKEIKEARSKGGVNEIAAAERAVAEKFLNELASKSSSAKEVVDFHKTVGHIELKRKEATEVKTALVKVLEAVKEGIINPPEKMKLILNELANRGDLTDTTSSYLQPLVAKYLKKDISFSAEDAELTEFEKDFKRLKDENPIAAEQLGQIVLDKLTELNIENREDLVKKWDLRLDSEGKINFNEEPSEQSEARKRSRERDASSERAQRVRYGLIPEDEMTQEDFDIFTDNLRKEQFDLYLTEKDKNFLKIIYFPKQFIEYIKTQKEELVQHGHSEHHALEHISEEIEKDLIGVVDKILTRFSETNPEKFFEQVASENFMRGIQTTLQTLGSFLDRLKTGLEEYDSKGKEKLHLYRSVGLDPIKEDIQVKRGYGEAEKPRMRYRPLSKPEEVSVSGFASYMRLLLDEYVSEREYLHNSRAILMHPKEGDHGFYENLAHYAEKIKTPALEEMFMLPNADILQDAINLYDKFVEEQFASQDWQHTSDMFLNKTGTVTTRLEQEVLEALVKMHPGKEESKLKSALFMAVGAHRGIFMTEEEKAAYADPRLNPDGSATYTSYYTNDTDPLTPLNPAHFFWRWQAERSLPAWLFLPVEGYNPMAGLRTTGEWDHREMWSRMQAYKESFIKGKDKMLLKDPVLLDFMMDIGNVGGPAKRRGWRIYYSTEGHFVAKEDAQGRTTENIDVLESWKAIENIGYELCTEFLFKGFGVPGSMRKADYSSSTEKQEFFRHLYKNYFVTDVSEFKEADLVNFLKKLSPEAKKIAELKLKRGLIREPDLQAQIEEERTNIFFGESLARLVAKRFPSKILRIDRDRFNENGESRWNHIRRKMMVPDSKGGSRNMSSLEFDKVMKNFGLAEAILRKEVSKQMKDNLKAYAAKTGLKLEDKKVGFHLDEVREGIDFRLTSERIRKSLEGKIDESEIIQVLELQRLIQENYTGSSSKGQEFLGKFGKFLNINLTEEGGYTFTFGLDDTDMSLVAFRGSGGRLLPRALKDTAAVEKGVVAEVIGLNDKLHAAAINGKHDFSEIVGSLKKIRDTLADVHGPDYGQKVAHHLSLAIINFFKKDTVARNLLTKAFVIGQPHSLVAEMYGGGLSNIWEWDVGTIDQFIYSLRTSRVIPLSKYDPSVGAPYDIKEKKIKVFGKEFVVSKKKVYRKPDTIWDEAALRRDAGAQTKHKVFEMLNTIVPLFILFILWKFISEAMKENEGKK